MARIGPRRMTTGLLIVGHGSRDPSANAEFESLVVAYRAARPDLDVAHGYVELAKPSLADALRELAQRTDSVVVLPLFLFAAGHVKNDIPLALAQARQDFPAVRFTVANALGVHPNLVELVFERARASLEGVREPAKTAIVVVGRGASDPDANGDFVKLCASWPKGARSGGWCLASSALRDLCSRRRWNWSPVRVLNGSSWCPTFSLAGG